MLNSLPPEITLQILSYLPVSSLAKLQIISQAWNSFFVHHGTTIYRQASFLHRFIDDNTIQLDSETLRRKYSKRVVRNVDSWKALCQARIRLRNAWNGVAPSQTLQKTTSFDHTRESIHRIKVDEQRGLIISTTGLNIPHVEVRDMETGENLWFLEPTLGRMFAHLEYSNGFLIFDRSTGHREVWRLSSLQDPLHHVPCGETPPEYDISAQPEDFMLEDSRRAMEWARFHSPVPTLPDVKPRGCFEPYAVLRSPEETRAYRFVYPTLMTTSHEKVYLWNVPSARIVEVISNIQTARTPVPDEENRNSTTENSSGAADVSTYLLGSIAYIDHSPTNVFLAGQYVLKVFTRTSVIDTTQSTQGSTSQLVLMMTSNKFRYGRWKYKISPGSRKRPLDSTLVPHPVEISTMDSSPAERLYDQFKAVHVSPCGSHLVILLCGAKLLIVPHFKNLEGKSEKVIYDHILDIQLCPPSSESIYLAYEEGDCGEGRVGVVTTRAVFVVALPYFPLDYAVMSPPVISISHASQLMSPDMLSRVSCLMLSDTRLWLNFDPSWFNYDTQMQGGLLHGWGLNFEKMLRKFQENELEYYGRAGNDLYVRGFPDIHDFRPYSAICEIDMFPSCDNM